MSCLNSLIPAELTDFKKKASEFVDELEGDILDQAEAIKGKAEGLLTDLENALPKLPEIPDLQTELKNLVGGEIEDAQKALDGYAGDAEKALGEQLKSLTEKFGDIPGISSVQDLINGNFDPCDILPKKADGTVKSTPPAKPIETPPAPPVVKKKQTKVETEEERTIAGGLAHRALTRATSTASRFVVSEKFTNRYPEFKELSEEALKERWIEAYRWYNTDLIISFADYIGIEYEDIARFWYLRPALKLKIYDEISKEYLEDRKGGIWKNAKKQYDKINFQKGWFSEGKKTEKTFEESIQIYYEDVYKEQIEESQGEANATTE